MLLGMIAHDVFCMSKQRCGDIGEPIGWHTTLGWTVFGAEFNKNLNIDFEGCNKVYGESPFRLFPIVATTLSVLCSFFSFSVVVVYNEGTFLLVFTPRCAFSY